jgi:hypothetical protein
MPTYSEVHDLLVGPINPDGKMLGGSATDPVGFWGATPITQPTSPRQNVIPNGASGVGNAAGALIHYDTTQSPGTGIATITTSEQSITVTGVLSTDFVIINKPTSQAGLALAMGRVSAANTVKLVFGNATAATLTPTSSEAYIVTTIPANLQLSATLSPAAIAASTVVEQQFTLSSQIAGPALGMICQVNKPTTQAGLAVLSSRVVSDNVVGITFANFTAATITPTASEAYLITALDGLVAASQLINFGVNVGTLSGVATITTSEQSATEAGIAATDVMVGMTKPTTQAGLGLVSGRVSAAATIKVTFVNPTAGTLTPTASEVYGVTVFRPSPGSPLSLFTATIAPASVAANTSAEQTFTVTGIVSGQPVAVSPQGNVAQGNNGVGIGGVRASATNTLAVTFVNVTGAAITPPSLSWVVAQFNQTTPTAGNFVSQLVSPLQTVIASQVKAVRGSLATAGLIKGS